MTAIPSPDGKYSVLMQDDYGEIAMGSRSFGHLTITGVEASLPDQLYGDAILWSPDSRFVALEALFEVNPFRTKLVVMQLPRCKVFTVRVQPQGTVTPLRWENPTCLIYTAWSVGVPRENFQWNVPGL